ncbi:hypothetical protein HPB50_023682 [Hyalomma asiaticum]|uniref:Uncharacterized protein n=1 Tax=Hyalomma asiaticum TaxID=266040 RepID=A0ACB7T6J3_HYAAI|nr:hypothetical protein HPB50_023682 [Hyalomma asiaticum]
MVPKPGTSREANIIDVQSRGTLEETLRLRYRQELPAVHDQMERQCRQRHSLQSQLDVLLSGPEDHLRGNEDAIPAVVSVLLERIGSFYGQMEKLDEAIFDEMPDYLSDHEALDAGKYRDKVVTLTANLNV